MATYDEAFVKAASSQAVKDYAKTKGAMPIAIGKEEATDLAERLASKEAWILFDSGTAAKSPNDLKITRWTRHATSM